MPIKESPTDRFIAYIDKINREELSICYKITYDKGTNRVWIKQGFPGTKEMSDNLFACMEKIGEKATELGLDVGQGDWKEYPRC